MNVEMTTTMENFFEKNKNKGGKDFVQWLLSQLNVSWSRSHLEMIVNMSLISPYKLIVFLDNQLNL